MRDIIERHNRLNGLLFSIGEFALIAVFAGGFGLYYLFHQRIIMGVIGVGIAANCLAVVALGLRQRREDRASGVQSSSFWNKEARAKLRRANPHMMRDTLILTVGTLLPFVGLAGVLRDSVDNKPTHTPAA